MEGRSQDRPIAKCAGTNLIPAIHPPENEITCKQVRHLGSARNEHRVTLWRRAVVHAEAESAIDIPFDLGVAGEAQLGIDRCADGCAGIIRYRRYEDFGEMS